jgi:excisionase family DNA binding protein
MDTRDTPHRSLDYPPGFDEFDVADRREPPLLYPMAEAAALLGISRSNVYQLLRDGRLTSVRIGSRRLIPRASLESFVDGLTAA